MSRCYLIQDPYHVYATSFIDVIHRKWGHRAICLYTDPKVRFYLESAFPILASDRVAASVELGGDDLAAVARRLGRKLDVLGVVPFSEQTISSAATLAEALGLSWCAPEVLRRFRDKFALKEHLRQRYPSIRMNASRRVSNARDVLEGELPERFVLKPNDGFGNSMVGMFDIGVTPAQLEAFFARRPDRAWLLEEYIGGTEYFVNGQVGARGELDVLAVFQYERVPANGRRNLDHLTWRVAHGSREFRQLADYTRQVITATGLTRSPFHLEAKIDERGPCLIEIGARLAGNRNAYLCNELHGGSVDLFDLAAHHYLTTAPYGPVRCDWERYDGSELVYVHGLSSDAGVVVSLDGTRDVERLPEFAGWVLKPHRGMELTPTDGLLTAPYCLLLKGPTRDRLREVSLKVRALIKIRTRGGSGSSGLRARLRRRLRWELFGRVRAQLRRLAS